MSDVQLDLFGLPTQETPSPAGVDPQLVPEAPSSGGRTPPPETPASNREPPSRQPVATTASAHPQRNEVLSSAEAAVDTMRAAGVDDDNGDYPLF